jgi:hypothetical protein
VAVGTYLTAHFSAIAGDWILDRIEPSRTQSFLDCATADIELARTFELRSYIHPKQKAGGDTLCLVPILSLNGKE